MPIITLPDSSERHFDHAVSIMQIAADIGPGLTKATLAGKVNGELVDAAYTINDDAKVSIITARDDEALELMRHDAAHVMAQAVQELYPNVQVTIGPAIENGFYYDFARDKPFTQEDLVDIEKRMHDIVKRNLPIVREEISRDEALKVFAGLGENYKVEIIDDIIPEGETVSIYRQGEWFDVCRGPHLPSTGMLGQGFKLMKVAGAYWRGNSDNVMLQRIYGTAWPDKKQLKQYLHQLAEAEKRDHRKIAKKLDLFHFQEQAPGMVFWHPKGWQVYKALRAFIDHELGNRGYKEINTPQIVDMSLWEASGHADKFGDDMFTVKSEGRAFAIKPMNCPCHVQVFNQGLKSYRDLPLRFSEFGSCHRNELSGALHGLMRVRAFLQDDGHIFCTEDQIQSEVDEFIDLLHAIYRTLGFADITYYLSTRPEQRVGSDQDWDKAEVALANALNAKQIDWTMLPGEGAFYGPKIEFHIKDCIGRSWQCGTMQVDFSMPGRLDASYIDEQGDKQVPVMLHRAILGSFERFIGILIENYEGKFPLWLAPTQAVVMTITDNQRKYAQKIGKILRNKGIRVNCDLRNEKIGFKIREHTLDRVPYLLVIGDRELETEQIAVRSREGDDLGCMTIEQLVEHLNAQGLLLTT